MMDGLLFGLGIAVVWLGSSALLALWLAHWVRRRDVRRQLDQLKRNMDDLATEIGKVLLPVFEELTRKLAAFAEVWNRTGGGA